MHDNRESRRETRRLILVFLLMFYVASEDILIVFDQVKTLKETMLNYTCNANPDDSRNNK